MRGVRRCARGGGVCRRHRLGGPRDSDARALVSKAKIASVLGLQHVVILRDIVGTSSPQNTSGVVHSVCTGAAWTGSMPTNQRAMLAALRSGRGAAFAIETWEPDQGSQYVSTWTDKGYDTMIGPSLVGAIVVPYSKPGKAHHAQVPASTTSSGSIGLVWTPFPGARSADAAWWNDSNFKIVAVGVLEASGKPVIKHPIKIGNTATVNFGL